MNNIKKMKYVNFAIANLLREKGFDEKCFFCYENDWGNHTCKLVLKERILDINDGLRNSSLSVYGGAHWDCISAPTLSEVLDWLRDKHNLHIYAFNTKSENCDDWCYEIEKLDDDWTFSKHYGKTHDECIEGAILQALVNFVEKDDDKKVESLIEITPSILERNNFTKEHDILLNKEFYISEDGRITIYPWQDYNETNLWSCHVDDNDMNTIGRIYIRFVSELKTFLTLCGYDETFFK